MSKTMYDIAVIGGGIAGSSAAIHLAKKGHSVLVLEKGHYPANKLCGEFLSIESTGYLQNLGVFDSVNRSGATIRNLSLISASGIRHDADLPGHATGISRSVLDELLFKRAIEVGADCHQRTNVTRVEGVLGAFLIQADSAQFHAKCVIGAFGKHSALNTAKEKSRSVAFKAHYQGTHSSSSIEMYSFPSGYVGISPVENGLTNACFIGSRHLLESAGGTSEGFINAACAANHSLKLRLSTMTRADKMLGISHIPFGVRGPLRGDMLMVGDTAGMIAPLCGDGMSMAMRSAEIAANVVGRYMSDDITALELKTIYARSWRREFLLRLRIGQLLQQVSTNSNAADLAIRLCNFAPKLSTFLVRVTRGRLPKPAHQF